MSTAPNRKTNEPESTPVDSWPAMRAWRTAIHSSGLKPRTALLGLLIADHINGSRGWEAWPSQSTLARISGDGADRRKTRARLVELQHAGWLDVPTAGHRGKAGRYRLTTPEGVGTDPVPREVGTESVPSDAEVGTDSDTRLGTDSAPRVGTDSGRKLARNPCPDVPSTTEGVAREHLQTRTAADPAPADAGPVAATTNHKPGRYVSRFLTEPMVVVQR